MGQVPPQSNWGAQDSAGQLLRSEWAARAAGAKPASSGEMPLAEPDLAQRSGDQVGGTLATDLSNPGARAVLNSPIGGVIRGLRDPIDAGAQLLTRGLQAAAPAGSQLENWAKTQAENVENVNQGAEKDYRENWRGGEPPGLDAGRLAGNVAAGGALSSLIPGVAVTTMGGRLLAGAAQAGLTGVLTPVEKTDDFWRQKAIQAGLGAGAGAAMPAVLGSASRMISPSVSPEIKILMDAGVRPTPGQMMGGTANRLEQAGTSVPVLGDLIQSARLRAMQQFNQGAINDVLQPIGQRVEGKIGRDAIVEMGDKVRDAYQAVVPRIGGNLDAKATQDFADLRTMASFMPKDRANQFEQILQGKVLDKISPSGGMTGESFKEAESDLGKLASGYLYNHSATSDERQLGGAIREAQSVLRDWLGRVSPDQAAELTAANQAYARMLRVENAATRAGQEPGIFSPAQLLASVKKLSSERQFARGEGLTQPYAEAGKSILGSTVPNNGTPFRALTALGLGSLAGHSVSPQLAMGTLGAGGAAAGFYNPVTQSALAHLLATRPAGADALADTLRQLGPQGSAAAGAAGGALAR